jgi:hypothetical protein
MHRVQQIEFLLVRIFSRRAAPCQILLATLRAFSSAVIDEERMSDSLHKSHAMVNVGGLGALRVEPRRLGVAYQVGLRIALDVTLLTYAVEFLRCFANKVVDLRAKRIVPHANGPVRTSHSGAGIDLRVTPHSAVDDACPEVVHMVCSNEGPMPERQED